MPDVLFVGETEETWPWRLLGVDVRVPSGDEATWAEEAAGRHAVVLVSEEVQRARPGAVEALSRLLPPGGALTVVPTVGEEGSIHLSLLRARTLKAMGVDTWTRSSGVPEANR